MQFVKYILFGEEVYYWSVLPQNKTFLGERHTTCSFLVRRSDNPKFKKNTLGKINGFALSEKTPIEIVKYIFRKWTKNGPLGSQFLALTAELNSLVIDNITNHGSLITVRCCQMA
jgi:hypothetical protein